MRRSLTCSFVALALAGCPIDHRPPEPDAGEEDEGPVEACAPFEIPAEQIDPALPWPSLRCADFPELCDLYAEEAIAEPDTAKAIDVVFVGDGFTEAKLAQYRALVAELTAALTTPADGFVARRPGLFNFYRVDVASRTPRVGNAERTDTALAGCVDIAGSGNLVVDERLAGLAATANVSVPAAAIDAIVVVMRTNAGTPNGSSGPVAAHPAFVRLNPLAGGATVNHELGHALFGLADEYALEPACYSPPDPPAFLTGDYFFELPNVSSEDTGQKWASIHPGATAGGLGYRHCVYHPGPACLMNEGSLPFCPVCADAIDRALDAREGKDDGPPRCGLELSLLPTYVHGTVGLGATVFDRNPPTHYSLSVDGVETGSGEVATWHRRIPGTLDSTKLGNGMHTVTLDCRDALGTTSRASVELKVQN